MSIGNSEYASLSQKLQQHERANSNDVIANIPRYAAPNLTSALPFYQNSEQDFITRAFTVGNYDDIRHLPATLREQQVQVTRESRMKAAMKFLRPFQPGDQKKTLFSAFEYLPSRYSLADEIASKERVASEAVRLTVGNGREFKPPSGARLLKQDDYDPDRSGQFPYLSGAFEDMDELKAAQRAFSEAANIFASVPFVQSGTQKLDDQPTRQMAWSMMHSLKKLILADWPEAELTIFENEHDCWVMRFEEGTVDSATGLLAYMNVMLRCNELVLAYRLNKVVEFWNNRPGDGGIYFVVRPPWVRPDGLETFYALHPEERDWRTGVNAMGVPGGGGGAAGSYATTNAPDADAAAADGTAGVGGVSRSGESGSGGLAQQQGTAGGLKSRKLPVPGG